jgi:hypothetical protein
VLFYTDKKEKKIFLIYKEIQSGAVARSYMRKGFLNMRKYFPIYEEAVYQCVSVYISVPYIYIHKYNVLLHSPVQEGRGSGSPPLHIKKHRSLQILTQYV